MKLSFSTNHWNNYSFDQFIDIATEYHFQGIEIHDVNALFDTAEPGKITALYRRILDKKLAISCIDLVADIVDPNVSWGRVGTNLGLNAGMTALYLVPGGGSAKAIKGAV